MKQLYEIFEEFEMAENENQAIDILRSGGFPMKEFLKYTFHPDITFVFKAPVPYRYQKTPAGMGYSSISMELPRVYIFIENNTRVSPNLTLQRKTELLIQILEAFEPKEADVFMNMMLKHTDVEGLTYEIAKKAFPENLP